MALAEKLSSIKSSIDGLLQYANGITGKADTRLGDAVRSLAAGYGQGGGGGVDSKTAKLSSNGTSISFTGLKGTPKAFSVVGDAQWSQSSTRFVAAVHSDGTNTYGVYFYRYSSTGTAYYSSSYFSWTYSNGTLTVKSSSSTNGGYFNSAINYRLIYSY